MTAPKATRSQYYGKCPPFIKFSLKNLSKYKKYKKFNSLTLQDECPLISSGTLAFLQDEEEREDIV